MRLVLSLLLSFLVLLFSVLSCSAGKEESNMTSSEAETDTLALVTEPPLFCNETCLVGAGRTAEYLPLLEGKKVGLVGNQSSLIGEVHLVDTLRALGVEIIRIFSPEHGFRGKANAGEKVVDGLDVETGLPVVSLYGKNRKPTPDQLKDLDVLLFDIQDVGARFYTYISTLHYVMQAAAESGTQLIVLDRPNPNGHYVDGPVLKKGFSSFVGMHKVPVVHGMSIGEYARMVNGEGWLGEGLQCDLQVIACKGWDHTLFYELPVAPSPNLPNMLSVYLYPGLCFFEGTVVSIGRGTDYPFQVVGHPDFEVDVLERLYSFKPEPNEGSSDPKLNGQTCYGYAFYQDDLKEVRERASLDISYLIEFYKKLNIGSEFFLKTNFINLLAGSDLLKKQIIDGVSEQEIRESWQDDLRVFKEIRSKYLLYTDYE